MKAITISQPYAGMIASGEKWVENRTWPTNYRGPLAIHAGKGTQYLTRKMLEGYVTGAIVATCDLIACIERDNPSEQDIAEMESAGVTLDQLERHEHAEGPWCWVLLEVRAANQPVSISGQQGLWEVPERILRDSIDALAY